MNILNIPIDYKPEIKSNIIKYEKFDLESHLEVLKKIAKYLEPDYEFTNKLEVVFKLLLLYFSGQTEFLIMYKKIYNKKASFKKGIFIIGSVGVGKSLIFEIFKIYTSKIIQQNSFQIHNAFEIVDNLNIYGKSYLDRFSNNYTSNHKSNPITCYIDDIASKDETVLHFGSKYNAMQEVLSTRYNILRKYGKLTHITSNLYPNEMNKIYGVRITDRMKEMFNIIELTGDSYRK